MTTSIDEFEVTLNMVETYDGVGPNRKKKLNFILFDTTVTRPSGKYAVGRKRDDTSTLTIEPGQSRIINIKLSDEWRWTFASNPLHVREGDARDYQVQASSTDKILKILCKHSNADPRLGQDDKLDFAVLLEQHQGRAVRIVIDPITENPPPEIGGGGGGGGPTPNTTPLPIA
ncbi:MAG: hypothetical protein K2W91_03645 [Novosphingobium sp.]|nr:hypothetical protein [Novosphingobium sp.]